MAKQNILDYNKLVSSFLDIGVTILFFDPNRSRHLEILTGFLKGYQRVKKKGYYVPNILKHDDTVGPQSYFDDDGYIGLNADKLVWSGGMVKGTPEGIAVHELGHARHFELLHFNKTKYANIPITFSQQEIGIIRFKLSGYAATSPQEFFAECFVSETFGIKLEPEIFVLRNIVLEGKRPASHT